MNKKGVSAIISIVLLIVLVVALAGFLLTTVRNLTEEKMEEASCFETLDKIKIDGSNTCYNKASEELRFLIEIKEIELDEILVSISSENKSKTFRLENQTKTIPNIRGSTGDSVKMPSENSGSVYYFNASAEDDFNGDPELIVVAPVLNGEQCEETDKLSTISYC